MFSPASGAIGQLIASEIGRQGGFAVRDDAWIAFASQVQRETGGVVTANNPLNLTDPGSSSLWARFGQHGWRSGGDAGEWHTNFAAFDTLQGGAAAAAANYLGDYYPNVIAALKAGADPVTLATEIEKSPWDSGHYAGTLHEAVAAALGQALPTPMLPSSSPAAAAPRAAAALRSLPSSGAAAMRSAPTHAQLIVLALVVLVVIVLASSI